VARPTSNREKLGILAASVAADRPDAIFLDSLIRQWAEFLRDTEEGVVATIAETLDETAATLQGRLAQLFPDGPGAERSIRQANRKIETLALARGRALDRIEAEYVPKRKSGANHYSVSSWFLHECFKKLTAELKALRGFSEHEDYRSPVRHSFIPKADLRDQVDALVQVMEAIKEGERRVKEGKGRTVAGLTLVAEFGRDGSTKLPGDPGFGVR